MTHTYTITGMTGKGCQSSVEESLKKVDGVLQAKVDLKREEVQITMESHIPLEYFQKILAPNYGITIKDSGNVFAKATVLPPGTEKRMATTVSHVFNLRLYQCGICTYEY